MKQLLNKTNKKGNKLAWTLGKSTFLAICLIKNTLASIAWIKL